MTPNLSSQESGSPSLVVRIVRRQVAQICRLRHPRKLFRALVTGYLICSNHLPESLVYVCVKAAGFDVAAPCGLSGARIGTANLQIGSGSWANRGLCIEGAGSVSIGNGVLIGPEVLIVTSLHEKVVGGRVRREPSYLPVRICDNCWIGARAMILPGVTVLDDVIVAAGAVVASDIGPGGVYGGVPARKIG
jgi:acetyltransferase-like isoleucine patch superfamily enzyme